VPCYTKEEMDRFERRFPFLIAIPVALILAGLAAMIPMDMNVPSSFSKDQWDALLTTLFLLCVTIAVIVLVWAGIQHSKYGFPEEKQTPAERRSGRIWGFGMLAATAVYVGLGLTMNWWHKAWAIYPIAALICAAFTVLLKKDDEP
ncbi:MAG: hypothetical protein K2M15_03495, partial [Oscillospiraceae bacterium]|nr:hypothetical protein [Oscillospiraceae bacterium]